MTCTRESEKQLEAQDYVLTEFWVFFYINLVVTIIAGQDEFGLEEKLKTK